MSIAIPRRATIFPLDIPIIQDGIMCTHWVLVEDLYGPRLTEEIAKKACENLEAAKWWADRNSDYVVIDR